jgi:hypothetical protein
MHVTLAEKDLLRVSIMQSIENLQKNPLATAERHKATFDLAIQARENLLKKVTDELRVVG